MVVTLTTMAEETRIYMHHIDLSFVVPGSRPIDSASPSEWHGGSEPDRGKVGKIEMFYPWYENCLMACRSSSAIY